jgi:CDP-diacylglycerol---serine O-phosphatidyltransferase
MKKHIPNFITSLNIMCGALAIIITLESKTPLYYASIFIGLGAIFDFLDGMAARALKAYSNIGKELDSLADVITFGMAPTCIVYSIMKQSLGIDNFSVANTSIVNLIFLLLPLVMVVLSAVRLAKFNVDTRQSESFIGLPTPANALFIASFPLIIFFENNTFIVYLVQNTYFLAITTIIFSLLLVSELPMFSLKFKNLSLKYNKTRFIFLGLSIILIILFQFTALALIILLFIVISIINRVFCKK